MIPTARPPTRPTPTPSARRGSTWRPCRRPRRGQDQGPARRSPWPWPRPWTTGPRCDATSGAIGRRGAADCRPPAPPTPTPGATGSATPSTPREPGAARRTARAWPARPRSTNCPRSSLDLLGSALLDAGDPQAAESVLTPGPAPPSRRRLAQLHLAQCLEKLARREEAIRYYTAARSIRPETAHELAHALEQQRRVGRGDRGLPGLTRLRPGNGRHLICLGRRSRPGPSPGGRCALDAAIAAPARGSSARDPTTPTPITTSAPPAPQGKLDEAIAEFREAIRLQPDDAEAHINLGILLCDEGRSTLPRRPSSVRRFGSSPTTLTPTTASASPWWPRETAGGDRRIPRGDPAPARLALAHNNLGSALRSQGKMAEAIGARTTESPTHRQMASGLSMPVGYKNGTDGSLQTALDAMLAARTPHAFLGIDGDGRTCVVQSNGNPWGCLILRGGRSGPNYSAENLKSASAQLARHNLPSRLIVDCSHANSNKDFRQQCNVWQSVIEQTCRRQLRDRRHDAGKQSGRRQSAARRRFFQTALRRLGHRSLHRLGRNRIADLRCSRQAGRRGSRALKVRDNLDRLAQQVAVHFVNFHRLADSLTASSTSIVRPDAAEILRAHQTAPRIMQLRAIEREAQIAQTAAALAAHDYSGRPSASDE